MYQAPMGRPISSPPNNSSNDDTPPTKRAYRYTTDAERAEWKADRDAGMTVNAIARKHGRSFETVKAALLADKPSTPGKPVQKPGESKQAYGARCFKWKMENHPQFKEEWRQKLSASVKRSLRKKKRKAEREAMAAERALNEKVAALMAPEFVPVPVVVPPTLWQRVMGWFR
jgi:predicted transcriptional regulator